MASNFERIAEAVSDAPDLDTGRVEAARNALARGEYKVSAERIAEKLIQIHAVARAGGGFRRN